MKVCGEDPDKVTAEQMEEIDVRVECLRCIKAGKLENGGRLVMNWTDGGKTLFIYFFLCEMITDTKN